MLRSNDGRQARECSQLLINLFPPPPSYRHRLSSEVAEVTESERGHSSQCTAALPLCPCVRAHFFFPFIYEWNYPLLLDRFPNQLPFGLTKVRRGPCLPPPPSQEDGDTHTETHQ